MDQVKIGQLIRTLRTQRGLTQKALAEDIGVGDKAVSKWERGLGCPDVSLLPEISRVLGIGLEALLSGQLDANDQERGNMKKLRFYVCPDCGSLITATAEAGVSCCGRTLLPLKPQKVESEDKLSVEKIDDSWFVASSHPMTKDHYISFVALLTGDTLLLRRLYPEWDLQTRIPCLGHGILLWYCTRHGLFQQII
ncbi:helix-turn-helix domain-containing protein [Flintibacter muris]|uniref:helix-turn-helix domain-containing protein n=1 Tax=Flintibacter muris TaxID=2941327 RepID=UPI00203F6284|nr:helix-turn-helix domain-containing protein [Flintibacter muris]